MGNATGSNKVWGPERLGWRWETGFKCESGESKHRDDRDLGIEDTLVLNLSFKMGMESDLNV